MKVHHEQVSARYRSIIEWLRAEGRVDVVEAAARLDVAQETIWAALPRTGTILLGPGQLTLALAHAIVSSPPEQLD